MAETHEDIATPYTRFQRIVQDQENMFLQEQIDQKTRMLRLGGEMTKEEQSQEQEQVDILRHAIIDRVLLHYFGKFDEKEARLGFNWLINFQGRGYGIRVTDENSIEIRVNEHEFTPKERESVRRSFDRSSYLSPLIGKRKIYLEGGNLAAALPLSLELGLLDEVKFARIATSPYSFIGRIRAIDTFTAETEKLVTYRFTPLGIRPLEQKAV